MTRPRAGAHTGGDHTPEAALLLLDERAGHTHWLAEHYDIIAELGRGGMSVVYLARDRATDRQVAVKLVGRGQAGDGGPAARFAREVRVAAELRHPNIVETVAVEEGAEATALVTAYVAGGTLRAALRAAAAEASEPWAYDRVARVLRDVAAALAYAHARRVVHCDVKPENVFLDGSPDGRDGRALLADFGIAHRLGDDVPHAAGEDAAGTPSYMAPEQVAGRGVDERTDVYALGLVGWELVAGRRPWQGEALHAVLHKQQHEALPSLAALRPDIPAYLLLAIEGALAKAPERRWRDGAEFLRRLTPTPAPLPPLLAPAGDDAGGATLRFVSAAAGAPTPGRDRRRAGPRRVAALAGILAVVGLAAVAPRLSERQRAVWDAGRDDTPAHGRTQMRAPARASTRPPAPVQTVTRAGTLAMDRPPVRPAATAAGRPIRGARGVDTRCASRAAADQRACVRAAVGPADARLTAAYEALLDAMQRSAGGGWEPAAVRSLRAEQRRWLAGRERTCGAAPSDGGAGPLASCLVDVTARRTAELRQRRDRFVLDAPRAADGAARPPRR